MLLLKKKVNEKYCEQLLLGIRDFTTEKYSDRYWYVAVIKLGEKKKNMNLSGFQMLISCYLEQWYKDLQSLLNISASSMHGFFSPTKQQSTLLPELPIYWSATSNNKHDFISSRSSSKLYLSWLCSKRTSVALSSYGCNSYSTKKN